MYKLTQKKTDNFKGVFWACQAASKDFTTRVSLTHLKIEPVNPDKNIFKIVGCDGHRLHAFTGQFEGMNPGLYEIIKCTRSEIVINRTEKKDTEYPQYQQVIPDYKNDYDGKIVRHGHKNNTQIFSKNFCLIARKTAPLAAMNFDYFKHLTAIETRIEFHCNSKDVRKPLVMEAPGYFGVLMAIEILDNEV